LDATWSLTGSRRAETGVSVRSSDENVAISSASDV
jgi:hypothetical protein